MNEKNDRPMQDIIPPRKSIRDIPLPEGRQAQINPVPGRKSVMEEVKEESIEEGPETPVSYSRKATDEIYAAPQYPEERGPRKVLWTIAIALIAGVALSFLFLFSKATLSIVIKNQSIPVDLTATSTKDGRDGTIPYSIVTLQKDASVELSGGIPAQAASSAPAAVSDQRKASGTITIYNNYSAAPQPLVATTRFQTKDGLVYRIDKDITVPGQTIVNGQSTPGSIDAIVFADQTGEKYNIGKTDFTIPGFQGTAKASGFYAKSKTDMTGGSSGSSASAGTVVPTGTDELSTKKAQLQNSITEALLAEVRTETPDTFVFFPSGLVINFTTSTEIQNGKTMLTGKGVALAPIFYKKILTDLVNKQNGTNYLVLDGWEGLTADMGNTTGLTTGDFPDLILKLKGTLAIGQDINVGELQRILAGKPKNQLTEILKGYPSVQSANASIRPFWKSSFPSDANKINIVLTKQK